MVFRTYVELDGRIVSFLGTTYVPVAHIAPGACGHVAFMVACPRILCVRFWYGWDRASECPYKIISLHLKMEP